MLKRIINTTIWTFIGLYFTTVILLHIPAVQTFIGLTASSKLSKKLGTHVTIGRIDLGFINRLIIDDVTILDQKGKQMLHASRLSVKIDLIPLMEKRLSVSSSQFFGVKANFYKEHAHSKPNYQFAIDSLYSGNKNDSTTSDIQINSIIIRRGALIYKNLYSKRNDRHSVKNININNISGHIILNKLNNDTINLKVKKISFNDNSGFDLRSLSLKIAGNKTGINLNDLKIELPQSKFFIDHITSNFKTGHKKNRPSRLQFNGKISDSYITLSDLAFLQPSLKKNNTKFYIYSDFSGTDTKLVIEKLRINNKEGILDVLTSCSIEKRQKDMNWQANLILFKLNNIGVKMLCENMKDFKQNKILMRLGNISIQGSGKGNVNSFTANGNINTEAGKAEFELNKQEKQQSLFIRTDGLDLKRITNNDNFNHISAKAKITKKQHNEIETYVDISQVEYRKYSYQNIKLECNYHDKCIKKCKFELNDPNGIVEISGKVNLKNTCSLSNLNIKVSNLNPSAMNLTDRWTNTQFNFNINANFVKNCPYNILGTFSLNDFSKVSQNSSYYIKNVVINSEIDNYGQQRISLQSDFANALIIGKFSPSTLTESLSNFISSKLPIMPGIKHHKNILNNNFTIKARIIDTQWLKQLFEIPLDIKSSLILDGALNDLDKSVKLNCQVPEFTYNNDYYKEAYISINTEKDTISTEAFIKKSSDNGKTFTCKINADASNNIMGATININDNENHPLRGIIKTKTNFYKNEKGLSTAEINIDRSHMQIGDSTWHMHPSSIVFNSESLYIKNFSIFNGAQFISINGKATENQNDSISINFNGINVAYILNMVNFHSVEFSGFASGKAHIVGAFGKKPQALAKIKVNEFKFENGRMGVLYANSYYDNELGRIVIDATAEDIDNKRTIIKGYISHKQNFIDLNITANNTRLEFVENFCSSFMSDVDAYAIGKVKLSGPLNSINLTGQLIANGSLSISSLNTTYELHNDTIRFIPDEIEFRKNIIYDRYGNNAIIDGNIHHKHLTNLSYDINIQANNLLAYDTSSNNIDTFYGTVFATGSCFISGKSGEVTMDISVTPEKGSNIIYNVSTQNAEDTREFIKWIYPQSKIKNNPRNLDLDKITTNTIDNKNNERQVSSDIRLNFLVNCNPDLTLKVIMDNKTGDYVELNGNGTLRATYYNKGTFDIFGNYIVDNGVYKLTVRNIIKKEFIFQQGGMIKFGGNPFAAALDLKALYVLNSVSLSDLNIGRSFSNNNVRVNCMMNVTGTPETPKVTFDLDMPTLSNDAKQMVSSVINAEEEMNQQVLYLLAVGRFYTQSNNNAPTEGTTQHNQASLAMQSILSGTISQQINTILGSMINNSNWNFGANISTGTEGFNDAEYEGILSGRLLNNRLLLNGQFGYRDNANATTSFIGDFDLKYLLYPNGNLAINVYNKTNDRYFTRNNLNTQGIGLLMKKDFNGLADLFGRKKKKVSKRNYKH